MKKRVTLIILAIILLTGCTNIKTSSLSELINESITSNVKIYNTYRSGYKFYLPASLTITDNSEYNEVIKSSEETLYLYVDVISYLNQAENTYTENSTSYYSYLFTYNEKSGYLEINSKNDKYLVEIMYNYAKIEVIVDENRINDVVCEAIIILSSIYYNDDILTSLSSETILTYSEENIDIFNTNGGENSNFLEYVEEDEEEEDSVIPDYDVIN